MTAAKLTEKQWLEQVRTLAKLFGWLTYHPHQSMRSEPGYPDLTLIRERLVFVELKTERGKLSEHQEKWRDACLRAGAEWYCWKPADLELAAAVLRRRTVI